jgi:ATP-binding cassette, subfamily C, bacterial
VRFFKALGGKFHQLRKFFSFIQSLPNDLHFLMGIIFFTGLSLFAAEVLFAWSMQFFLSQIGILGLERIPVTSPWNGFIIFLSFGTLRSIVLSARLYFQQILTVKFSYLSRKQVSDYSLENAGRLNVSEVTAMYSDVVQRSAAFLNGFMSLVFNMTLGICYFFICCYYSVWGSIFSILMVFILLTPLFLMGKGISSLSEKIGSVWKQQNQVLIDGLRNFLFINIHGLVPQEQTRMQKLAADYKDHFKSFALVYGIRSSYTPIAGIIVLGLVGVFSFTYGFGVPGEVLITFFYMFIRFSQASGDLINSWSECELNQEAMLTLKKWFSIASPKQKALSDDAAGLKSIETLSIEDLSFAYQGQDYLFTNFNLTLSKGDILYISGESGAGKSTLLSLVLGLLEPQKGSVNINSTNVLQLHLRGSGLVTYSGPSPLLMNGSLKANLLYGNKFANDVSEDQMKSLLIELGMGGIDLNMMIDDNVGLSTGQKQRISIARAFLMNPRLLIFDEATSNLDSDTEEIVLNMINQRRTQMITVLVSHRESMKKFATKYLHFDRKLY